MTSHNPPFFYAAAFVCGVLASFAFPPYFILPLWIIGTGGFFILITGAGSGLRAFWLGWWFGFGHFIAGVYWIAYSLLVDAERFAWLMPFAVSLIPAALALYTGAIVWAAYRLPLSGWRKAAGFACVWALAELLRARLFTGFPWNLAGYVWSVSDAMLQTAPLWGIYGLSFIAVLAAALPAQLCSFDSGRFRLSRDGWRPAAFAALLVAILYAGGAWRLSHAPAVGGSGMAVRLVQPNIPQKLKWLPGERDAALLKHLELTRLPAAGPRPDVIIWPEASIPFILEKEPRLRRKMADTLSSGQYLITGALRAEEGYSGGFRLWNSVRALDASGRIAANYDKHKLVPFGEFIPWREYFPWVSKITHGDVDFSRGHGPESITLDGIPPFSPLICYEAIFPNSVVDRASRPSWLLNVTNDAWFGDSPGPHQHLHMARMRAAEQGLPLVRVANTGISAVTDGYGRIVASIGLNEMGVKDVNFPAALPDSSFYWFREYGETGMASVVAGILIFLLFLDRLRRSR